MEIHEKTPELLALWLDEAQTAATEPVENPPRRKRRRRRRPRRRNQEPGGGQGPTDD
jgi:hypothetical protein